MKLHEARGLCKCCYNHLREGRAGRDCLANYPLQGQLSRRVEGREALVDTSSHRRSSVLQNRRPAQEGFTLSKAQVLAIQVKDVKDPE